MSRLKHILLAVLLLCLPVWYQQSAAGPAPLATPANLADVKAQLTRYKESGQYDRDVAAALAKAQQYVERRASMASKPALVLDIDETSLSNWRQIQANDFGRFVDGPCDLLPKGPCGQRAWQMRAESTVIGPTLALYKAARAKGVSAFFLTGRSEIVRAATEANLKNAGYDNWTALIMRPAGTSTPSAADFKTPERAKIAAQGFTIIANVGDQPSDLGGGYSERTFLVPNPFYRIP